MKPMRIQLLATAVALACQAVIAQTQTEAAPAVALPANAAETPIAAAPIARLSVRSDAAVLRADGRSRLRFEVRAEDAEGRPLSSGRLMVSARGAVLPDGMMSGLGSGLEPQPIELRDGVAYFTLLAPATPGPVQLAVFAGAVRAETELHFLPEARDLLAIGVVDGVLSFSRSQTGSLQPVGLNDGFEREIVGWSRSLGDDASLAGRTAFFIKGKIAGDALLTAAYDSDKVSRVPLSQLVDPNQVYPVYGDASVMQLEAQSKDRLFVRIDQDHNYALYGDFSTLATLAPALPAAPAGGRPQWSLSASPWRTAPRTVEPVLLGKYNRNLTGLRGHYESDDLKGDAFLVSDSLTHVSEEFAGNGTSGPFAVANGNALQNSETVQVLVRDRHQLGLIRSQATLTRYVDYTFEPFSGRILLTNPLASLTPEGDPQYLRISYEVDQGGPAFLTYGASASARAGALGHIGASAVSDENPVSPYRLLSANAQLGLGAHLQLNLEAAQTDATHYQDNGWLYSSPTGQAGELSSSASGTAQRAELAYQDDALDLRLWWLQADTTFYNQSSGVAPGRRDAGLEARGSIDARTDVYAQYHASANLLSDGARQDARLGLQLRATPELQFDVSLRSIEDNLAMPPEALIPGNSAAPAGSATSAGGFFGTGTLSGNSSVDPLTGSSVGNLAPLGSTQSPLLTHPLEATTLRAGMDWQPAPKWQLGAGYESALDGSGYYRADAGALYAIGDQERLFVRAESQSGLASPGSLNAADRSNTLSAGLVHALSGQTSVFSEYRLVDAYADSKASSSDQMLVNGLQNRRSVGEGVQLSSSAEYLSVLSGTRQEAAALTGALDFHASPLWRASARLEFRRLFDDQTLAGDQSRDQLLSTLSYARKLDSDWTLLLKNYYLFQRNHDDAAGNPMGNSRQERFLSGFAWRPTDNNRFNALARYEYKAVDDAAQLLGDRYEAHIGSLNLDYKPSRAWQASTRLAAKASSDYSVATPDQGFNAWLWSVRATVDLTDHWDLGLLLSTLQQSDGRVSQDARGLEAGYLVQRNVWVSVGYNWVGYSDRDLGGTDYTQQGWYLRLRAKFDEHAF